MKVAADIMTVSPTAPRHTPWQHHLLHQNISIAQTGVIDVAASAKPHAPHLCGQRRQETIVPGVANRVLHLHSTTHNSMREAVCVCDITMTRTHTGL